MILCQDHRLKDLDRRSKITKVIFYMSKDPDHFNDLDLLAKRSPIFPIYGAPLCSILFMCICLKSESRVPSKIWSGQTADWNCPPPLLLLHRRRQVVQSKTRVGATKAPGQIFSQSSRHRSPPSPSTGGLNEFLVNGPGHK